MQVKALHQLANRLVERSQAREALVAKHRDDPALRYLHAHLGLGLVAGLVGPSGNDRHAVVCLYSRLFVLPFRSV